MTEEEKKAIELLKQEPDYSLSYYKRENAIDIVLNLIQKQDTEINKLNNVIDRMSNIFLKTYRDWEVTRFIFDNHICSKIKNPNSEEDDCYADIYNDNACSDCIKEYFMKE